MSNTAYETKQAILEEAGLSHRTLGEKATGATDGSNKDFYVKHKPLSDANYDDNVDAQDVVAYVNGSAVAVSSIDVTSGKISLTSAPAASTAVTIDYTYCPVSDNYIENVREEAQDFVDDFMSDVDTTPYDSPSATIRKVTRWYGAALMLIRDYGFNQDTELTSKDGYKKLKLAEDTLQAYYDKGGQSGASGNGADDVAVSTEDDLFGRDSDLAVSKDDMFMRAPDLDD